MLLLSYAISLNLQFSEFFNFEDKFEKRIKLIPVYQDRPTDFNISPLKLSVKWS